MWSNLLHNLESVSLELLVEWDEAERKKVTEVNICLNGNGSGTRWQEKARHRACTRMQGLRSLPSRPCGAIRRWGGPSGPAKPSASTPSRLQTNGFQKRTHSKQARISSFVNSVPAMLALKRLQASPLPVALGPGAVAVPVRDEPVARGVPVTVSVAVRVTAMDDSRGSVPLS